MTDTKQAKEKLRAKARARRGKMGAAARAEASAQICRHLAAIAELAQAPMVVGFWPTACEVDIRHFLVNSIFGGRSVSLPKTAGRGRPMTLHKMSLGRLNLVTTPSGFAEPSQESQRVTAEKNTFFLVPSISVDHAGNRLGSGLGFYDITIAGMSGMTFVTPVFSCQLAESLPAERHDVRVHYAVTERGVLNFREV